jgi:hypothetical protein
MKLHPETHAATLAKQTAEGYLVVEISRGIKQPAHPEGYFSVTYELYNSKRAFDLGSTEAVSSCGSSDETILAAFPELEPLVALHMSDVETGEPDHAEANGWYWYAGAYDLPRRYGPRLEDIYKHQLDEAGLPDTDEGRRRLMYQRACRLLRVGSIPDGLDREAFAEFVNAQRERWAREAREANALIDELSNRSVEVPADEPAGEEWSKTFEDGLKVKAELSGATHDVIGGHFVYKVVVSAPSSTGHGRTSYTAKFTGSTADWDESRIDAREAALGVLREMTEYLDTTADDLAIEFGIDNDPDYAGAMKAMRRMEAATERMREPLATNRDLFTAA